MLAETRMDEATERERPEAGHGREAAERSRSGQTYKFGWVFSVSSLTTCVDLGVINYWTPWLGAWGSPLGIVSAGWFTAAGIAAAVVRPWSWYVLLVTPGVGLLWVSLFVTIVAPSFMDMTIAAIGSVTSHVICFVYFYKRRALFRARWRWFALERWCPWLKGPETLGPGARPGFAGLSPARRRLFMVVVLLAALIRTLR